MITREAAIVTLYDFINSGILAEDLCDELTDIANCITHEELGLDTWCADDDVIDLFIAKRADYIAKKHGVKTGMALWEAKRACPDITFLPPRMDLYLRFSRMAHEIKEKAWGLPASDLLFVGKSTEKKLARIGIHTIGDIARADEHFLHSHLGKHGNMLWAFANGYDESPVKYENTHAPIKSIGNSTTTRRDLVNNEDVKVIVYVIAESVAARLRENGFKCNVVEISVRDNSLYSFTRQRKLAHATYITQEIAEMAYQLFLENYTWERPIKCRFRVHPKSVTKMKNKIRELTNRSNGWGNEYRALKLNRRMATT